MSNTMMAAMNTRQYKLEIPSAAVGAAGVRFLNSGSRIINIGRRVVGCAVPQETVSVPQGGRVGGIV